MSYLIQICRKFVYILLFFCCVRLSDNKVYSCLYKLSVEDDEISLPGKIRKISSQDYVAYINLCDDLPVQYCGSGKVCIKKTGNDRDFISGKELIPAYVTNTLPKSNNTLFLKSISAPFCEKLQKTPQVLVRFQCDNDSKDLPALIVNDECDFEIRLLHPTLCTPKCAVRVYNKLIDLRPLKKIYHIHDVLGKISIGFCTENPECSNSNSVACLIKGNKTIQLSGELDTLQYNDLSNTILLRGKFKGNNRQDDKTLEINVKCDWTKSEPELFFLNLPNQTKIYRFVMMTSHNCEKYDFPLQLTKGPFIFDLSSLHKRNDYYKVNVAEKKDIFMNIFGPLEWNDEPNDCSETFSQICLKNGSDYINLGSIQTKPRFEDDFFYISFKNGRVCDQRPKNDLYQQYETTIEFVCDGYNEGLRLIDIKNCAARFQWKTQAACPKYDKSDCSVSHPSEQQCLIQLDNVFYNLTRLYSKTGKYIIEDPNEKVQYFLNICGTVIDDDVECSDNNLAFIRKLSEPDIRKRTVGLGKMTQYFVQDNYLVIELSSGGFCSQHDYQSFIYFECSDKEEQPELKNTTNCRIDFIWKTSVVCPITKAKNIDTKCVFESDVSSEKIDLNSLNNEHKYIHINVSGMQYIFDTCSVYKGKCSLDEQCVYVPAKKHLLTHGSNSFVEFILNKPCNSIYDFNRTLMQLVCDPIKNNDHFSPPKIAECTLTYKFVSNLICKQKDATFYSYGKDATLTETSHRNCFISNPKTNYTFNIQKLKLNFSASDCPNVEFNYTKNLVELTYKTDKICENQGGKSKLFTYKILLSCSEHTSHNVQNTVCREVYLFEQDEYCKLLEDKENSIIWIIVATGGLLTILVLMTWLYLKYHKRCKDGQYVFSYIKYGDR